MGVFFRCPTSESVRLESRAPLGLIAGARGVERVIYRRMVRLICAGWLPQGEVFGWSGAAALTVGRRTRVCFVLLKAEKAGHSTCSPTTSASRRSAVFGCHPSMIANDQHQPANSRAIATFATAGRFFRSVNFTHWWCSR
jgi:hypothetical protein